MIDHPFSAFRQKGKKNKQPYLASALDSEKSENQSKKEMTLDFVIIVIGQLPKQPFCLFCTYEIISTQK